MNILHTEWMCSKGGQPKRVLEDLKIIKELGYKAYVACNTKSWLYRAAMANGITVFDVPFDHIAGPKSFFKLVKIIKQNNINIVHTHSSKDSYVAAFSAKLCGKKVVRTRHMDFENPPGLLYKMADAIVTTGKKIRLELIDAGIDEKKVFSIPSYPDETIFNRNEDIRNIKRNEYGAEKDDIVIGTLTGLKRDKRPHLLLDILTNISKNIKNVKLFVAGVDNDVVFKQEFFKKTDKLNLNERVKFLGYVDSYEFLNAIDIYVCPSKKEGIPQSLMQAMMVGRACVSSDVGSIKELNADNNMILVKKDDLKGFEKHITRLILDSGLRKTLANKNYFLSRRYFCRTKVKQMLKDMYEKL